MWELSWPARHDSLHGLLCCNWFPANFLIHFCSDTGQILMLSKYPEQLINKSCLCRIVLWWFVLSTVSEPGQAYHIQPWYFLYLKSPCLAHCYCCTNYDRIELVIMLITLCQSNYSLQCWWQCSRPLTDPLLLFQVKWLICTIKVYTSQRWLLLFWKRVFCELRDQVKNRKLSDNDTLSGPVVCLPALWPALAIQKIWLKAWWKCLHQQARFWSNIRLANHCPRLNCQSYDIRNHTIKITERIVEFLDMRIVRAFLNFLQIVIFICKKWLWTCADSLWRSSEFAFICVRIFSFSSTFCAILNSLQALDRIETPFKFWLRDSQSL